MRSPGSKTGQITCYLIRTYRLLATNEDRAIAGFPPINDLEFVENELAERHRYFRDISRNVVDRLPTEDLLKTVSEIVSDDTQGGERHASSLIENLVAAYETGAQPFLEAERSSADAVIARIRKNVARGEGHIRQSIDLLSSIMTRWNSVARPIQQVCRASGVDHSASKDLAYTVRSLAIDLNNEHSMPAMAEKLSNSLRREFQMLAEFADRVEDDLRVLTDVKEARAQQTKDKAEFESSITFGENTGLGLFPSRLDISPAGVIWRGRTYKLDDIQGVAWGGTRHSVNGIPTGTTYEIRFAANGEDVKINVRNAEIYSKFVECFWRGIGVRILFDSAKHLRAGGSMQFPDSAIPSFFTRTRTSEPKPCFDLYIR